MKTILSYFLILFFVISKADSVKAQTTVIDYTNWTSATGCNIFGTGPLVNGLQHRTVLGTPTYETVNKSIVLQSDISNGSTRGTSFRINYNFKKGYTYKITIKAWRLKGTSTSSDIRLRSELVNSSTTTSQCAGPEFNNNFGGSTATYQYNDINNGTDKDYIYNFNSLQSAFSHLIVGALINFNSTIQIAYIKKITIEETAPELVLDPKTLPTTCGITTTQAFTVSNPSGLENITSYEWNLGSASNGWLYNGNPAPQIIPTTSNSLSLTSVDNATKVNNVAVTIKVNNVNFKSYTSTITRNPPTLTIVGLFEICDTKDYIIPDLPTGATVAWSISPATGIASLSTSGNTATLTPTGDGNVMLSASIIACGSPIDLTRAIRVGLVPLQGWIYTAPPSSSYPLYPDQYDYNICFSQRDIMLVFPGATNLSAVAYSGPYVSSVVDDVVYWTYEPSNSSQSIRVEYDVACGHVVQVLYFTNTCTPFNYRISPNPANTELNIDYTVDDKTESVDAGNLVPVIILFNEKGEKVSLKIIMDGKFKKTFDTRDIPNGTYYLHIIEGKETVKKQLIIKH